MTRIVNSLLDELRIERSVGCREDHQCPAGFFCAVTQLSCQKCLSCAELNRVPRGREGNETSCVTSITACGPCFAGLVPGQADNKCVPPTDEQLLLPYEWAVIVVGLLLAVIICAAAVYVLRNFHMFKVLASTTNTSVHTPIDVEASAPQLPPSYYSDVAAIPPALGNHRVEDETAPFIKPIPSPRTGEAREVSSCQAAQVFNDPCYVRTPQPPSYESLNEHETLPTIHEDLNSNDESNSSANAAEESNASERSAAVGHAASAKLLQVRQDTNNNSGGEEDAGGYSAFARGGTFIINVIKNVNSVQCNDLVL